MEQVSAALALQKAIRARLVATPAVTDLVPATAILDRNQRPAPSPSIILGEAQEVDEGDSLSRKRTRIFHTIHVWKQEASLAGATAINGAIRAALHERPTLGPAFHLADLKIASARAVRDPDGATSHGIVTVEALVLEYGP
ncbi:DUF3168 domain-containing protein [Roseovarius sp. A46]|uniref:DUF3168 domain-containing protein n=1 Tax=Roseovarius sp. A46 TaxID=2109331 RepID=UPI001F51219F|nr:DUF3168 domain-containing protein [Roseovarius sp. A46]